MPEGFDVFLSYNSRDKLVVEEVGAQLRRRGLRVWLDKWELRPGFPWQEGLEEGVRASRAVAVFVGAGGLGSWQEPEMRAFIARSRREKIPVIPVLLPGCPDSPQLTLFLEALTWVDLRGGLTHDGLAQLIWGITGANEGTRGAARIGPSKHSELPNNPKPLQAWENASVGIGLLALVVALPIWLWMRSPESPPPLQKPTIYAIRVQVLDPQGHPVSDSVVRASTGNEPQRVPDGWWEVEVPLAKVPADGQISLYAEHHAWEGNRVDLRLSADPNPRVEIRLKEPQTWIRGRVVDEFDRALQGVRVTRQDGTSAEAITDSAGRFALKVSVPRDTRVRLRAEHEGLAPGDEFCYAGRDSCWIILEER